MKPQYTAQDIATFFIKKGTTPLKLQKLLYYAQVWHYVFTRQKLFEDKISAWIDGPVVHDVWTNFKYIRRSAPIPLRKADLTIYYDDQTYDILSQVWDAYGHLTGADLIDLTHTELPWYLARKGVPADVASKRTVVIDDNTTRFFNPNSEENIPFVPSYDSLGRVTNRVL